MANSGTLYFNEDNYEDAHHINMNSGILNFQNIPHEVQYEININSGRINVENCPKCSFHVSINSGRITSDNVKFSYGINSGRIDIPNEKRTPKKYRSNQSEVTNEEVKFTNSVIGNNNIFKGKVSFGNSNINATNFSLGSIPVRMIRDGNDLKFEILTIDEFYVNGNKHNIAEEGTAPRVPEYHQASSISIGNYSLIVKNGQFFINTADKALRVFVNNVLLS